MEREQYRKNAYDMLYLCRCAVKGETPDPQRVEALDYEGLFRVCQEHVLTACVDYALEAAGVKRKEFTDAKDKSIRKNIILDAERRKIEKRLEEEKIWYMPLKGAILKDWYPKLGMRQMSDNDILCDSEARRRIKDIMEDLGFTCAHYEICNDDSYTKPPVCNFEMHNELFTTNHAGNLHEYYSNVKQRLIRNEKSEYGYHFTDEDFYIYLLAHEYKHFVSGGTGVRSLLDIYVIMGKYGDSLDWDYMHTELEKLGIADYERKSRELAMKLFREEPLSEAETELLDYYILSGAYGTLEHKTQNLLEDKAQGSKGRYILHRLFPPMETIKSSWPFFYKHKYLLPLLFFKRLFDAVFIKRRKVRRELQTIHQNSEKTE